MEKLVSSSSDLAENYDEEGLEMSARQTHCLTEIRTWIQTDAKFYGRTDDKFIIAFLRGCEYDLEMTKKTLDTYYNCRTAIPHWWANRDLRDENTMAVAHLKTTTVLIDKLLNQPTVIITKAERIGPDLNNFNDYCKLNSIIVDIVMRRTNCQLNGAIWIIDCHNYPMWFALQVLKPTAIRDVLKGVYHGSPIRIQKLVFVDPPFLAYVARKLIQPFISYEIHQLFRFCSSDSVSDHVAAQLLPTEYGGEAGPMAEHDEAFLREMTAFNDYLVDDNKYGYQP